MREGGLLGFFLELVWSSFLNLFRESLGVDSIDVPLHVDRFFQIIPKECLLFFNGLALTCLINTQRRAEVFSDNLESLRPTTIGSPFNSTKLHRFESARRTVINLSDVSPSWRRRVSFAHSKITLRITTKWSSNLVLTVSYFFQLCRAQFKRG